MPLSGFANRHKKKKTLKCVRSAAIKGNTRRKVHVWCVRTSDVCATTSHSFELLCSVYLMHIFNDLSSIYRLHLSVNYLSHNTLLWVVSCFRFD